MKQNYEAKALRDAINYLQGEAQRLRLPEVADLLGKAIAQLDRTQSLRRSPTPPRTFP